MAKKMRVRSGGKHKVMSALAAVSGLGNLAGRGRKSHGHKGFRYEVELKPKDLLSTDKLVALAVAKAAIDQLKTGSGEGLSSDERREIERSVSALVAGKKFEKSSSVDLGFSLEYQANIDGKFGKAALKIGNKGEEGAATIGSRDNFGSLTVCPNKFSFKGKDKDGADAKVDLSSKARAAGRFAAQVMYNLLDTGLTTKKRKVYEAGEGGAVKETMRLFLGPDSSSKDAKMELPSAVCYRVKIDKSLQQKAAANMFLQQTSSASSEMTSRVAKVISDFREGAGASFPSRKRSPYGDVAETSTLEGLGEMDVEESETIMLDGMRRRRKGAKRKSAARKSPARRRKSSSKRKASRRRKK